jgi:prolyl-tRNA synthetase
MQDRKALQAGTSHFLGQNFSRASGIRFQTPQETEELAWTTSWGASTRLIGGVIMTHGDDDGIIMPPKVAPAHVVLMPIIRKEKDRAPIMGFVEELAKSLVDVQYAGRHLVVEIDNRDIGGNRNWDWIKRGIPVRVEIGPRDMSEDSVFIARRDKDHKDKFSMKRDRFIKEIPNILDEIQDHLFQRALAFRKEHTHIIDDHQAFYDFFTPKNPEKPEIHGGFASSFWCGENRCEEIIKNDLKVTIRCIPFETGTGNGRCLVCQAPNSSRVIFAKAY